MKKEKLQPVANGKGSIEILSHFSCGKCLKWWSVGDAPPARKEWFCPWCGAPNKIGPRKSRRNA